jgi:hypothetical protein
VISRRLAILLLAALAAVTAVVVAAVDAADTPERRFGLGQIRFNGLGPEAWAARWRHEHRRLLQARRRLQVRLELIAEQPRVAIALMFGPYTGQALAVSGCETGYTYSTTARNGQYVGLFQMGARERAIYGDGATALEQARAAYVYFVVSGRDWSPWTCGWAARGKR